MNARLRVAAALAALAPCVGAAARDRELPAASDGRNAWIAVERTTPEGSRHALLHHAPAMGCDCAREAFLLDRAPEAMAAADSRAWLVMPVAAGGRRDVYATLALRNPLTGAFYSLPAGRLEIHPSLPGSDELRGIAADGDRLLALLGDGPLLELKAGSWRPDERAAAAGCRLATVAGRPALVDPAGGFRLRAADGSWSPADPRSVGPGFERYVDGAPRAVALVRVAGEGLRAVVPGPGGPVTRAALPKAERASAILGLGDAIAVFTAVGDGGATIRRVDPLDGVTGPAVILGEQQADARGWICAAAGAFGALAALATVAVRRRLRLKSASPERR